MSDAETLRGFLGTLFVADSAALVFFTVAKQGGTLPAKLPITLGPQLPFKGQVITLALCLAAILVIRAGSLFPERTASIAKAERLVAVSLMVISLVTIGLGGLKLLGDPGLLADD